MWTRLGTSLENAIKKGNKLPVLSGFYNLENKFEGDFYMIKKIKEYFELQSLYKKSKKVLIINAASTVTSVKNIVEKVETFIDSQENVASLSKEDLNTMTKFMSEMMGNKDMQETAIKEIVKNIKTDK